MWWHSFEIIIFHFGLIVVTSSVEFVVKHNIILLGVLSSQEFILGARNSEEDRCGSMTVRDLSELLFDEIEGRWWLCMCCLEEVWVFIVVMLLWHGDENLDLEGIEEEWIVRIQEYNGKYLDKILDDQILFWCLRGYDLFIYLGIIWIFSLILSISVVGWVICSDWLLLVLCSMD